MFRQEMWFVDKTFDDNNNSACYGNNIPIYNTRTVTVRRGKIGWITAGYHDDLNEFNKKKKLYMQLHVE